MEEANHKHLYSESSHGRPFSVVPSKSGIVTEHHQNAERMYITTLDPE